MRSTRMTIGMTCWLALAGCSEKPPVDDVKIKTAPALGAGDDSKNLASSKSKEKGANEPYQATVAGFRFVVPADWEEQPPKSEFVLGEFTIPGEEGACRLTLSSAGGQIDENVRRWHDQFLPGPDDPEPKESEIKFDGHPGTLVELGGTYSDMLTRASNKNWRMLGVAVPIGPTNYFVKLTGPSKMVSQRREQFVKFVESARMDK